MLQPDVSVGAGSVGSPQYQSPRWWEDAAARRAGGGALICEGVQMGEGRLGLS